MGYTSVVDSAGLSSIRLAAVGSQICEIPQNSDRIRTYSRSRSSKVIDLGVHRKRIVDLSVTLDVSPTAYRYSFIHSFILFHRTQVT